MNKSFSIELSIDREELKNKLLDLGAKRVLFGEVEKVNGVKMLECSVTFYESKESKIMDFLRNKNGVHFFRF